MIRPLSREPAGDCSGPTDQPRNQGAKLRGVSDGASIPCTWPWSRPARVSATARPAIAPTPKATGNARRRHQRAKEHGRRAAEVRTGGVAGAVAGIDQDRVVAQFLRKLVGDDRDHGGDAQHRRGGEGQRDQQAIARDLAQLLALHAVLVPDVARRLRVERIVDDGCRRFHADHVGSRMLCTYAGPGTECLPASAVDARRPADGSDDHVLDPDAVWRCEPGWVLLMRGTTGSGPAQFHRSPPVDVSGPRLLVAIDA